MKQISHYLLFWLGDWMIQRSSMSSPGALAGEGGCFSINYFDEAALGEGKSFRPDVVHIVRRSDPNMRFWRDGGQFVSEVNDINEGTDTLFHDGENVS